MDSNVECAAFKALISEGSLAEASSKRERVKSTRTIRVAAETFDLILGNMYHLCLKTRKQLLIKDALFMAARFYLDCDSEMQRSLVYRFGERGVKGHFAFERKDKFVINLLPAELDLLHSVSTSIEEIRKIHQPMSQTIVVLLLLLPALVD